MEMDIYDGSRLNYSPFDVNQDKKFTDSDYVVQGSESIPASGKKSTVGIIPTPGILSDGDVEYKYTPGTSGGIQKTVENPGPTINGRQSWRQLR